MQDAKRAVILTSPALLDKDVPSGQFNTRKTSSHGYHIQFYWPFLGRRFYYCSSSVVMDSAYHSTAVRMVPSRECCWGLRFRIFEYLHWGGTVPAGGREGRAEKGGRGRRNHLSKQIRVQGHFWWKSIQDPTVATSNYVMDKAQQVFKCSCLLPWRKKKKKEGLWAKLGGDVSVRVKHWPWV